MGLITVAVAITQACLTMLFLNYFGTIGASYSIVVGSILKASTIVYYSQKVYSMPWFFNSNKMS